MGGDVARRGSGGRVVADRFLGGTGKWAQFVWNKQATYLVWAVICDWAW